MHVFNDQYEFDETPCSNNSLNNIDIVFYAKYKVADQI